MLSDFFLQPEELNPADIRKNAGISHLCIDFWVRDEQSSYNRYIQLQFILTN